MEPTNFINPQALSSALAALGCYSLWLIKFVDSLVHAYNYYLCSLKCVFLCSMWKFVVEL